MKLRAHDVTVGVFALAGEMLILGANSNIIATFYKNRFYSSYGGSGDHSGCQPDISAYILGTSHRPQEC